MRFQWLFSSRSKAVEPLGAVPTAKRGGADTGESYDSCAPPTACGLLHRFCRPTGESRRGRHVAEV
jgi:hypothetical protein